MSRHPTSGANISEIHTSSAMASGASAPPSTVTNELPIGAPIRMPQPSSRPMQPPPPYDNTMVNVNQGPSSSTEQPQIIYVIPTRIGYTACQLFWFRIGGLIIGLIIAGIIIGVAKSSISSSSGY